MPALVDLRPPPSLQRLVNRDLDDGFGWQQRVDDEQEQTAAGGKPRPACSVEHLVKGTPMRVVGFSAQP